MHIIPFLILFKSEINFKNSVEIFFREKTLLTFLCLLLSEISLDRHLSSASFQQLHCCHLVNVFYKDNKTKDLDSL